MRGNGVFRGASAWLFVAAALWMIEFQGRGLLRVHDDVAGKNGILAPTKPHPLAIVDAEVAVRHSSSLAGRPPIMMPLLMSLRLPITQNVFSRQKKKPSVSQPSAVQRDMIVSACSLPGCSPLRRASRSWRKCIQETGRELAGNVEQCPLLRIGVKAYHFPFVLKVREGSRELFSQQISPTTWSDLKIALDDTAGKQQLVVLALLVPETQGPFEGAWFDYIAFFEN